MASCGRIEESVRLSWRDPVGVHAANDSYVYFWKTGQDVDCKEELLGEVLITGQQHIAIHALIYVVQEDIMNSMCGVIDRLDWHIASGWAFVDWRR